MSFPFDLSVTLRVVFLTIYVFLLVVGIVQCFFAATSPRPKRRVVYFVALFVLTNFVVLPMCWVVIRSAPKLDDKLIFVVMAFVATAFAWRISSLEEKWIVRIYSALMGALSGLVILVIVKSLATIGWVPFAVCLSIGAAIGWALAYYQYDVAKIVFFASSGAATVAQSLLGLFELASERAIGQIATDRIFHFVFPVLYLIFSPSDWLQLVFWPLALLLFIAGIQVQCLRMRQTEQRTPRLCDSVSGRLARLWDRIQRRFVVR